MHITNIPLVLSSLTFLGPWKVALDVGNRPSAMCWGYLAMTSALVHLTKQPYHLHGDGNCIPYFFWIDQVAGIAANIRVLMDGYATDTFGFLFSCVAVLYNAVIFWIGKYHKNMVYDKRYDVSVPIHVGTHLLGAIGGIAVVLYRAFKNGQEFS